MRRSHPPLLKRTLHQLAELVMLTACILAAATAGLNVLDLLRMTLVTTSSQEAHEHATPETYRCLSGHCCSGLQRSGRSLFDHSQQLVAPWRQSWVVSVSQELVSTLVRKHARFSTVSLASRGLSDRCCTRCQGPSAGCSAANRSMAEDLRARHSRKDQEALLGMHGGQDCLSKGMVGRSPCHRLSLPPLTHRTGARSRIMSAQTTSEQ